MQLQLKLYPVAIAGYATDPSKSEDAVKRNSPPKRAVVGIVPDSNELIEGLYISANVFAPTVVEFWCSDFIASSFKAGQAVNINAAVSARGDRLSINIKEIEISGKWYGVNAVDDDILF